MERLALGTVAQLGSLYDARNEKFCGISILNRQPPPNAVRRTDNQSTDCKFVLVDKISDKFSKLDISAELSVSILSGLITVKGSGEYFKDEKHSARAVQVTLSYKITTADEELNILNDEVKQCIELDALNHAGATHVVVGIQWGANLMVTAEYKNEENKDATKLGGSLQVELTKIASGVLDLSGMAKVNHGAGESDGKTEFSLSIKGDVLTEGELPQTIEGARDLMAKLPVLVRNANNGKGQPLRYVLLPLTAIRSYFSTNLGAHVVLKSLNEASILRMVQVFDVINEAKQRVNDLHTDVMRFDRYLPNGVLQLVTEIQSSAAISESKFRGKLQKLLVQVRAGEADPSELEKLREDYEKEPYSGYNILASLPTKFGAVHSKIEDFKRLSKLGVVFVSKNESSVENKLLEYGSNDCYILFSRSEAKTTNQDLWNKSFHLFQKLREKHRVGGGDATFLYVDLDAAPHLAPQSGQDTAIQHFKNGRCVSKDMVKAYTADGGMCFIRSSSITHTMQRHNNRASLEIRCPGSLTGDCELEQHRWRCFKCKSEIEYGFDGCFYCTCGQGRVETYSYRCNSDKHGVDFEAFPLDGTVLKEYLGKFCRRVGIILKIENILLT